MTDPHNDSERSAPLTGAALAQWCYNFPNLAARTIEGLRHDAQSVGMREALEKAAHRLRELGYVDFANDCLAASQPSPAATVETEGSGVEMIDSMTPETLANWRDDGDCNAGVRAEPQSSSVPQEEDCGCIGAVIGQHERSCPLSRPQHLHTTNQEK